MSTTPYEPSFPPSRQDYRELIDHHYLIRGLTLAPLILLPIAIKTSAQYGPLSMWTGIGMNLMHPPDLPPVPDPPPLPPTPAPADTITVVHRRHQLQQPFRHALR